MNLTMFYLMLRSAIRSKAEMNEINHAVLYFDRVNKLFKIKVDGIKKGIFCERDFEEINGDAITMKLADGTIDHLRITGEVPSLEMTVDFLLRQTTVIADVKQPDGTIKKIKYTV